MLRFVQALIAFRRRQPTVRRGAFLTGKAAKPGELPDVSWFGPDGKPVDWNAVGSSLTSVFGTSGADRPGRPAGDGHAPLPARQPQEFARAARWPRASTGGCSSTRPPNRPDDIYPEADGPPLGPGPVVLDSHSLRCYVAE